MSELLSRLEIERRKAPGATEAELVQGIAAGVIDQLGITEPPVDVEMIASWLGIDRVVVDEQLDESGCLLRRDDGRFEIRVNATEPATRQRFTIGHECAHTFFPGWASRTRYRCSPLDQAGTHPGIESLCDIAASEMLLPSRLFGPDTRSGTFGFTALEHLAHRYDASLEATGRRYVAARPEPAALLVLSVRQKPTEPSSPAPPRLRVDYALCQGDWPYFLPSKSVAPGDPMDRAADGEPVAERCTITGICVEPVLVDVHARLCPIVVDGTSRTRVVALLRQPGHER